MAFCSNKGLDISLNESDKDLLVPGFAEEVGVVIEVKSEDLKDVKEYLAKKTSTLVKLRRMRKRNKYY